MRSGDYELAISKCIQKLQHKDNDEAAIVLEAAYDKAYYRDINEIAFLKKEGNPSNNMKVYQLYQSIRSRYNQVQPLLPLHIKSKNRDAIFNNVADEDLIVSKNQAAEYLYAKSLQLIANKNRFDARQANFNLVQVKTLFGNYKNADQLIEETSISGKTLILYNVINLGINSLPSNLYSNLNSLSLYNLNSQWQEFRLPSADTLTKFHYKLILNVNNVIVSPDNIAENKYTETKQVEDGWEYVLDAHGNVAKDSLGNDIKKPKFKTITAFVSEVSQMKVATIQCNLNLIDLSTGNLVFSLPVQNTNTFEHHYAVANGDLKALTDASKEKIKVPPLPFPNELDLLMGCSEQIKPLIYNLISQNKGYIL